jgi:uncharacterized protein YbcI
MASIRTRAQVESEISEAIIRFEKEYMGRGPVETKSYLLDDLILIRLQAVLTKAEIQLAKSTESVRGRELIKEVRIQLLEKGRPLLEAVVEDVTGCKVVSMHTDISTVTGERVIIFTLNQIPEIAT